MRLFALIVLLTSCYSPGYRDCEVLCASGACPSGFECVADVCRDPAATQTCTEVLGDAGIGKDTPGADGDGDGIADAVDNCPMIANTDQYNEDGDMLGDACDPCPIVAGVTLAEAMSDVDGDLIGDACDPRMESAGDTVILYDGFNTTPANTTAPGAADMFMFANGQAIATPADDRTANAAWAPPALMPDVRPYTMLTRVTIVQLGNAAATHGAGLIDNVGFDGSASACIFGVAPDINPPKGLIAAQAQMQLDTALSAAATTPPIADGVVLPLAMIHPAGAGSGAGGTWVCATSTSMGTTTVIGQAPTVVSTIPSIGIHSRGVRATFDFLYVVDSPMP